MRLIKKIIVCVCIVTVIATFAGVKINSKKSLLSDKSSDANYALWQSAVMSVAKNSDYDKLSKLANAEHLSLIDAFMKHTEVTGVKGSGTTFSITLTVPDLESIVVKAKSDNGFKAEYKKLKLQKADSTALNDTIIKYCTAIVLAGDYDVETLDCDVKVDSTGKKVSSIKGYSDKLIELLQYDATGIFSATTEVKSEADKEVAKTLANINKEQSTEDSFVYTENGCRFLVTNVKVVTSASEISKYLADLSASNKAIVTNDKAVYVTYDVQNLSNKTCVVNSHVALADDSGIYKNDGILVVGLSDCIKIKARKIKTVSDYVVGPQTASLVWLSPQANFKFVE